MTEALSFIRGLASMGDSPKDIGEEQKNNVLLVEFPHVTGGDYTMSNADHARSLVVQFLGRLSKLGIPGTFMINKKGSLIIDTGISLGAAEEGYNGDE